MKFEWDPGKSAANRTKHGIDFGAAKDLWLDENRTEIHLPYPYNFGEAFKGKGGSFI